MVWEGYGFSQEVLEDILLEYLDEKVRSGRRTRRGATVFSWQGDEWPPIIRVMWKEYPVARCEICGEPLSDEECEVRERLDAFWDWLMSDDFYDDIKGDD